MFHTRQAKLTLFRASALGPGTDCLHAESASAFVGYTAPELWHLLSLDAPTVAVLWTVFLARCAGVHLGWALPVSLFLAVWILYAGDRLLDARPWSGTEGESDLLERHYFHRRYQTPFLAGILVCIFVLLFVLGYADRRILFLYATPGALLAAWFLLVHSKRARPHPQKPLAKELVVGLFFPAAVFLPTFAQAPAWGWKLLPFALLLAAVCTLNCLFLYAWEHGAHPGILQAHSTTRWGVRRLRLLAWSTLAISLIASLMLAVPRRGMRHTGKSLVSFDLACALAVLCLLLLHWHHRRLQPLALRVAADAALLTPLLFFRLHG